MFCFFPEEGSLMDHLPATPRDQWRRVQLARYLIDYRDVRVEQMRFNELGEVEYYGIPDAELSDIIEQGIAFRTSGCPGKYATKRVITGTRSTGSNATPGLRSHGSATCRFVTNVSVPDRTNPVPLNWTSATGPVPSIDRRG